MQLLLAFGGAIVNPIILTVNKFKEYNSSEKYVCSALDATHTAKAFYDSEGKIHIGTSSSNKNATMSVVVYRIK